MGLRPRVALSVTKSLGAVLDDKSYQAAELEQINLVKESVFQHFLLGIVQSPWAHHARHGSFHLGRSLVEGEGSSHLGEMK